jgi:hypothetical protein
MSTVTPDGRIQSGKVVGGWIGVDLDGTLAEYNGWQGLVHIGPPIMPMVERIKVWLAAGIEVRIFTARMSEGTDAAGHHRFHFMKRMDQWLVDVGLPVLRYTNVKDYDMLELYDDRAVQVEFNTGRLIGHSTRAESYHEG